jgi:hypothetical protein
MTVREWIRLQPETIQAEVWKRLTAYLSNSEIKQVMSRVQGGDSVMQAHDDLGLIDKYQVELANIMHIIKRRN